MGQIYELIFALAVVQIVCAAFLRANSHARKCASGAIRHQRATPANRKGHAAACPIHYNMKYTRYTKINSHDIYPNGTLRPTAIIKELQESGNYPKLMVMQEELKTLPFGEVWEEYCRVCGVPAGSEWFDEVVDYENKVLALRK